MANNVDKSKNLTSDVYGINSYVENIKKEFTPEVNEDTLMLGIFGYTGQVFSDLIQNSIVMASEFSNESIPTKAKFEKNIIAHALSLGINDIFAVPAQFDVLLTFIEEDIETWARAKSTDVSFDGSWTFVFDKNIPIYIGDFEFHVDYDIEIRKVILTTQGEKKYAYTARYLIDNVNQISDISNPYLTAPVQMMVNDRSVIFTKCTLRQVKKTTVYKKILADNSISSKTITFEFEGQLAAFDIDVVEGGSSESIHLVPIYEGLTPDDDSQRYFYYSYLDSKVIRIKFNRESYQPRINSEVTINVQTTDGDDANFTYNPSAYPVLTLESDKYGYNNIGCELRPVTGDSQNGTDKKSIAELKKYIPKEALSRGSITNITDLENFFNMLNTEDSKLYFYKKRDNALERLYYSYLLMRDSWNNVIPMNTIDIHLPKPTFVNGYLDLDSGVFYMNKEVVDDEVVYTNPIATQDLVNGICYVDKETKKTYLWAPNDSEPDEFHFEEYDSVILGALDGSRYTFKKGTILQLLNGEKYATPYVVDYIDGYMKDGKFYLTKEQDPANVRAYIYSDEMRPSAGPIYRDIDNGLKQYYGTDGDDAKFVPISDNYDRDEFYYTIPYNFTISSSPLYGMYSLTTMDTKKFLDFTYINGNCLYQYIATNIHWNRGYNENSNIYELSISMEQNTDSKDGIQVVRFDDDRSVHSSLIRCVAVLYNEKDEPLRWTEGVNVTRESDIQANIYSFKFYFKTDDRMDINNKIEILKTVDDTLDGPEFIPDADKKEMIYFRNKRSEIYQIDPDIFNAAEGYFSANTKCVIHVLTHESANVVAESTNANGAAINNLNDLDKLISNIDGYILTNSYTIENGIDFFHDYSEIVNSTVTVSKTEGDSEYFIVTGVPVVKHDYFNNEDNAIALSDELIKRKAYIEDSMDVLEDAFGINFKFMNTYGPSKMFTFEEENINTLVDRVNISLNFRLKLTSNYDTNIANDITADIKAYIEDLDSIRSLHIPGLITEINRKYMESIVYFEFLGVNGYGTDKQHLFSQTMPDELKVPEFINVHTLKDGTPDITITLV